jgi:hypothetical protein
VSQCVHQQQDGTPPAQQIFPMQRRGRPAAASRGNRQQQSTAERTRASGRKENQRARRGSAANRAPQGQKNAHQLRIAASWFPPANCVRKQADSTSSGADARSRHAELAAEDGGMTERRGNTADASTACSATHFPPSVSSFSVLSSAPLARSLRPARRPAKRNGCKNPTENRAAAVAKEQGHRKQGAGRRVDKKQTRATASATWRRHRDTQPSLRTAAPTPSRLLRAVCAASEGKEDHEQRHRHGCASACVTCVPSALAAAAPGRRRCAQAVCGWLTVNPAHPRRLSNHHAPADALCSPSARTGLLLALCQALWSTVLRPAACRLPRAQSSTPQPQPTQHHRDTIAAS